MELWVALQLMEEKVQEEESAEMERHLVSIVALHATHVWFQWLDPTCGIVPEAGGARAGAGARECEGAGRGAGGREY